MASLGGEPFAIGVRGMLRHADRREILGAHTKAHLNIRRSRPRHGIGDRVQLRLVAANLHHHSFLLLVDEQRVGVPRGLGLGHPERRNLHVVLRPLRLLPAGFTGGTAHHELTAWDRE